MREIIKKFIKEKGIEPKEEFVDFILKLRSLPPGVGIGFRRPAYGIRSKREKVYLPLFRVGIADFHRARNGKVIALLTQRVRIEIIRRIVNNKVKGG